MDMEPIIEVLPEGWREKARELNAFRRSGDYLKTPEDLLRVLLLWADLGTFGHTAAFLRFWRGRVLHLLDNLPGACYPGTRTTQMR